LLRIFFFEEEMEIAAADWSIFLQSDLEKFSSTSKKLTQFLREVSDGSK